MAFVDMSQGLADGATVAVLDLRTLKTSPLFRGGTNPRYSSTGHLIFARGGSLFAVPFDSKNAQVTGVERRLLDGVATVKNGAAQYAVGGSATLAYVTGTEGIGDDELVWIDRQGNAETIREGAFLSEPRLSPDDSQLLVTSRTGANIDLWLLDLETSAFRPLTSDPGSRFRDRRGGDRGACPRLHAHPQRGSRDPGGYRRVRGLGVCLLVVTR